MAENKTQPSDADVGAYLARVEPDRRREDSQALLRLMKRVVRLEPVLWGESIVGFGRYHYRYESGHEGEFFLTGFAPRKAAMTVYIMPGFKQYEDQLARLGKHRRSVSCLYLNRLDGIDLKALEEIIRDSVRRMKKMYEWWPA
jgi:hypothetical protein